MDDNTSAIVAQLPPLARNALIYIASRPGWQVVAYSQGRAIGIFRNGVKSGGFWTDPYKWYLARGVITDDEKQATFELVGFRSRQHANGHRWMEVMGADGAAFIGIMPVIESKGRGSHADANADGTDSGERPPVVTLPA